MRAKAYAPGPSVIDYQEPNDGAHLVAEAVSLDADVRSVVLLRPFTGLSVRKTG